ALARWVMGGGAARLILDVEISVMANAIEDKRMLELISFPLKATRIGCAEARSASFGD
ncbi:hypothetical protein BMETH_357811752403, partial [methanotrophic bacterial endosymbiont of Bathymodiolus sp.]